MKRRRCQAGKRCTNCSATSLLTIWATVAARLGMGDKIEGAVGPERPCDVHVEASLREIGDGLCA